MSVVTIDYDKLSKISKSASNAASEMNDYIDALTKKVTKKYSDITGGASSKTSSSEYYVNHKISKLKEKKEYYSNFSEAVTKFSKNAKEADKQVAKQIKSSTYDFVETHDYIEVNWWTELKEFFIDLKNACPLFEAISAIIGATIDEFKNLFADLKHWYKCGGGKEVIGVVLAVAGAVAAVVLAVVAIVTAAGFFAICAAIAAVITAVNAIYNVYSSAKSLKSKLKGDPGWAKIYGDQDTVQDALRQTNFGNGILNKISFVGAGVIDTVKTFCDVMVIINSVKNVCNTVKEIKAYANRSQTRGFGDVFKMYLKNEKNYNNKSVRDYIKDRVSKKDPLKQLDNKISSLKDTVQIIKSGSDKAKTLKEISKLERLKDIKDVGDLYKKAADVSGKLYDYTIGGNFSLKEFGKDIADEVVGKFKTTDIMNKGWKLYKGNIKSLVNDYRGYRANSKRGYRYTY